MLLIILKLTQFIVLFAKIENLNVIVVIYLNEIFYDIINFYNIEISKFITISISKKKKKKKKIKKYTNRLFKKKIFILKFFIKKSDFEFYNDIELFKYIIKILNFKF